jgi:predicted TIM-barrel fold metal-dependent hydrolase
VLRFVEGDRKGDKDLTQTYPLRIDAYAHIVPPRYKELLHEVCPEECDRKVTPFPALWDLEERFRIMDRYGELMQVITLGWPPIEAVADPVKAAELSRLANDEISELVQKYPSRFVAGIAHLPMNNLDAAMQELERSIIELRLRGVQIYSPVNDKPLDSPEFWQLYEKMEQYDLPIFIHPMRSGPDYKGEKISKYMIGSIFGWPYETSAAMTRLVFSGVLEKYPNLKIVTHHCGGMIPYFADRLVEFMDQAEMRGHERRRLTKSPIEYFKKFYADTALYGNTPALMCAHSFFGSEHLVFGIDMPLGDSTLGYRNYRQTINAIDAMSISDEDKKKIYEDNARKLMRLPI